MKMRLLAILQVFSILWLTRALVATASLGNLGCDEFCGNISIPFPFGIGSDCYLNESFAVTCDNSSGSPKAYLTSIGMELLGISLAGNVRVRNPVISSNCSSTGSGTQVEVDLSGSPFIFSNTYSRFTATGCDNYVTILHNQSIVGGCLSMCTTDDSRGCYGLNCCQTNIPPFIKSFAANMSKVSNNGNGDGCRSAFMVDQDWFESVSLDAVREMENVPAVLEWGSYQGYCGPDGVSVSFCNDNGICWTQLGQSHLCICSVDQYASDNLYNSYSYGGYCKGCLDQKMYECNLLCIYTPGGHNCSCPVDFRHYGANRCISLYDGIFGGKSRIAVVGIGFGSGFGLLFLVIGTWWSWKLMKRRKIVKLKQKCFERNGGLLLEQQLSSGENNVEQAKLFTSEELEKATDNYHPDRILGQGGQGTVYKGMLTSGKIVAIKKSKVVDESKLQQFINEVVILSQISHRNVVKLLGCCLETEVPLLVYEFIPNGTLYQLVHDPNAEFWITWEMRLQIAAEVAGAIAYLHSTAAIPIYHRDIKSSNILLDEKYKAKVSDFGTSKSIEFDQTHVTTRVQGTFGYLDPEYFQSSQFTEKSDVYSFGVVLVELLTGQRPILSAGSDRQRSLATYFLESMEETRLYDIIDDRVLKEGGKEEIMAVAKLAKSCLNLNGKKRPTMKAVAMELEAIKASQRAGSTIHENFEEVDYALSDFEPWDAVSSSSTRTFLSSTRTVAVDVQGQPLLPNSR